MTRRDENTARVLPPEEGADGEAAPAVMTREGPRARPLETAVFGTAIFLSAFLLLLVQPMVGKMVLPHFGGSPAVWTTCMMFFQCVLVLGYVYSHLLTTRLRLLHQTLIHGVLLCLAGATLPVALPAVATQIDPVRAGVATVLTSLALTCGAPFFLVATTSPLLQKWASLGGAQPYRLYGASNLGSLLAIILFPTLFEGNFTLAEQSRFWAMGFAAFGLLAAGCACLALTNAKNAVKPAPEAGVEARPGSAAPETAAAVWGRRLGWMTLAAVPSSLLLGSTTYLTVDIASIPLLWMLPLSVYLLTFILVFDDTEARLGRACSRFFPVAVVGLLAYMYAAPPASILMTVGLHLAGLFVVAMHCHGSLARSRPGNARLTEFYLCLSVGGAVGGLLNGLVAPLVLDRMIEYPIVLALGAFLVRRREPEGPTRSALATDLVGPVLIGAIAAFLSWGYYGDHFNLSAQAAALGLLRGTFERLVAFAIPMFLTLLLLPSRRRFGLAAVFALGGVLLGTDESSVVLRERTFFGALKVNADDAGGIHRLANGTTMHGVQRVGDASQRSVPLSYYHASGPIGHAFKLYGGAPEDVAVVGLGAGTIAAYGKSGMNLTFFEIDKAVVKIAQDPSLFTYVGDCRQRGCNVDIVLGDARLQVAASRQQFDLMVIDAFSSDAIPFHLLTREAVQLFVAHLKNGGAVLFHISNRYLDLEPVIGNIAHDLHLAALTARDPRTQKDDPEKAASAYVAVARGDAAVRFIEDDKGFWKPALRKRKVGVWTDDFSNVFDVFATAN